ncbi:MAG: hypothetical protein ACLTEE_11320 [Anaerobutyricum hallii]
MAEKDVLSYNSSIIMTKNMALPLQHKKEGQLKREVRYCVLHWRNFINRRMAENKNALESAASDAGIIAVDVILTRRSDL